MKIKLLSKTNQWSKYYQTFRGTLKLNRCLQLIWIITEAVANRIKSRGKVEETRERELAKMIYSIDLWMTLMGLLKLANKSNPDPRWILFRIAGQIVLQISRQWWLAMEAEILVERHNNHELRMKLPKLWARTRSLEESKEEKGQLTNLWIWEAPPIFLAENLKLDLQNIPRQ